jgi:hypothetical protein
MDADIGVEDGKSPPSSPSAPEYVPVPGQARRGDRRAGGLGP